MGRNSLKKHKKKHKKEMKKRKQEKCRSTSSDSSEEEWVEKDIPVSKEKETTVLETEKETEDWLSASDNLFATITRRELRQKNQPERIEEPKSSIDAMGQSDRELNPFWKDGGTGLPSHINESCNTMVGTVGDMGLNWLKKALSRAKERAIEENKSLEDIVTPTWGSLQKLQDLIEEAENKSNKKWSNSNRDRNRRSSPGRDSDYHKGTSRDGSKEHQRDYKNERYDSKERRKIGHHSNFSERYYSSSRNKDSFSSDFKDRKNYSHTSSDHSSKFKKPSDELSLNKRSSQESDMPSKRSAFMKPDDNYKHFQNSESSYSRTRNECDQETFAGFRKPIDESAERKRGWKKTLSSKQSPDRTEEKKYSPTHSLDKPETSSRKSPSGSPLPEEKPEILTVEEMNKLGAKIIKAEMLGNMELAKSLQSKLNKAQAWLTGKNKRSTKDAEVILTRTDNKGFTHPAPASTSAHYSKAKKTKVQTHEDGKRTRYFADDDKYSLNDLYQQERFTSAFDANDMYSRLASKGVGKDGSARDMDDMFEETAQVDRGDEWKEFKEKQRAVWENDKREKALDACQRCINSNSSLRQLVVSIQDKVYLCVPPYGSIVEGHCLIIPNQHIPSATLADEDVWEEIMDMRKLLVKMFEEDDEDIIFFENVRNLNKFPHMVIHCVPVPRETGDIAPIYFKKALLECETEWSNNKKVIDLKGRDVRKAVPKGLPYFSVDFGLQSGFAHVIEDEQLFPRNFAEEIIGGMMDLDHALWRKQKKDDPEVLHKKAQALIKKFKNFMAKA